MVIEENMYILNRFQRNVRSFFYGSLYKELEKNRKQLDSSTREKPSHNGSVLQFTKLRNATLIRHIWPKQKIHNIHILNIKQCVWHPLLKYIYTCNLIPYTIYMTFSFTWYPRDIIHIVCHVNSKLVVARCITCDKMNATVVPAAQIILHSSHGWFWCLYLIFTILQKSINSFTTIIL